MSALKNLKIEVFEHKKGLFSSYNHAFQMKKR